MTYAGLHVYDANGLSLRAWMEWDGESLQILVQERGAKYPLTIDPIAQQAFLKASNTEPTDLFGRAVAVSGDLVIVGAFQEDSNATGVNGDQNNNGATQSGAAYIFERNGGTWNQQAYLKASNTDPFDAFGRSVAISGELAVVGAWSEDSSATQVDGNQSDNGAFDAGAAYVFERIGGAWTQQAYLKASNAEAGDRFGQSVAISGETIIVGAHEEESGATGVNGNQSDNSVTDSGAVYLFERTGGNWSQQAYLKASNPGAIDRFGYSVSMSGETVVVGAPLEDSDATGVEGDQNNNGASASGAAYIFDRIGGV
ncbi:MAG: hypothetical protein GY930_00510 [bacterium]|nr:hypothetical protein [bacterium]